MQPVKLELAIKIMDKLMNEDDVADKGWKEQRSSSRQLLYFCKMLGFVNMRNGSFALGLPISACN
jgi:hypothetical protein